MSSARIYPFPTAARRLNPPALVLYVEHPYRREPAGFSPLLSVTLVAAFLYLSGAVDVARHDTLYAALLAAVWGCYFFHKKLLGMRVLGPFLIRAGRLLLPAATAGFFGGVYWLILSPHG